MLENSVEYIIVWYRTDNYVCSIVFKEMELPTIAINFNNGLTEPQLKLGHG